MLRYSLHAGARLPAICEQKLEAGERAAGTAYLQVACPIIWGRTPNMYKLVGRAAGVW